MIAYSGIDRLDYQILIQTFDNVYIYFHFKRTKIVVSISDHKSHGVFLKTYTYLATTRDKCPHSSLQTLNSHNYRNINKQTEPRYINTYPGKGRDISIRGSNSRLVLFESSKTLVRI